LSVAKEYRLAYSETARLLFYLRAWARRKRKRRVSAMRRLVFAALLALVLVLLSASTAE
jgi:hypothetical protein